MSDQLKQAVLVITCAPDELQPVDLIKDVMEIDEVPQSEIIVHDRHNLTVYPWHITTKYYDADINFVELKERDIVSEAFCNSIEAVVIFFDNHNDDSYKGVETWMPFVKEFEAEIKILVCKTAEETAPIPKLTIQTWCIANGFELVEINPLDERSDDDDTEDDFIESKSVRRIMQALYAHPWPKLVLKNVPEYKPSSKFRELLANESLDNGLSALSLTEEKKSEAESRVDSLLQENKQVFEGLDEENGDFENLFDKFVDMKEAAATLTGEERKVYAEKTALAFYQALGGDDGDSDGSDDLNL